MTASRRGLGVIAGVGLVLAALAVAFRVAETGDAPDALRLIGRLHPMLVHFPIGLLLLAAVLEVASVDRRFRRVRHATGVVLLLGAAGAVGAVIAGLLLSGEGGYDPARVERHGWLGILVAMCAVAAAALRALRRRWPLARRAYPPLLAATVATLLAAGHLGGSLTHGSDYLATYLPAPLRGWLASTGGVRGGIVHIDSALVYADLVEPVLLARCAGCHGPERVEGGLRLDSASHLLRGGDGGPAVLAGLPDDSELFRRVTLPPGHDEAMPPDGAAPLPVGETELIRWWIDAGARLDTRVGEVEEIPSSVATYLRRIAPAPAEEESGLYALSVPTADPGALSALRRAGFGVEPIAADLPLLQVTAVNQRRTFGDGELGRLTPVGPQIAWLDLAGTGVTDRGLTALGGMPNLVRLSLARTDVGGDGLRALDGLERLEYLNLYGTAVDDVALGHLRRLPRLRRLYLWETRVTEGGVRGLQARFPGLEVIRGADPAPPIQ